MRRRTAMTWGGVGAGITGLGLALVVCSSVSCNGTLTEYEPYPVYPPRLDPLVAANPPSIPAGPAAAGKLDEWLLEHNARGGKVYDPRTIAAEHRTAVTAAVDKLFGTPIAPTVDHPLAESMGLTPEALGEGSQLYRRHCANCHGLTGDGRGPAGLFVFPHPRDVRLGKMKFHTTESGPMRADLERVIKVGVPGTSMPPFGIADEKTIDRLTTATIHLSLRGEVESKLLVCLLADDGDGAPADWNAEAKQQLEKALNRWIAASGKTLPVPAESVDDDDSIRRGQASFLSTKAGCVSCHEDYGRKDAYRYDAWGTVSRVANLTERAFRGGSEPADLYRRIRLGIPTVGMPAQPSLTDAEVWDLVHFVRVMATPAKLPQNVRESVYPDLK